jgi:hypothetical protein
MILYMFILPEWILIVRCYSNFLCYINFFNHKQGTIFDLRINDCYVDYKKYVYYELLYSYFQFVFMYYYDDQSAVVG